MTDSIVSRARRVALSGMFVVAGISVVGACGSSTSPAAGDGGIADRGVSGATAASTSPDPCSLVPITDVEKLLGGKSQAPDAETRTTGSKSCVWKLQPGSGEVDGSAIGRMLTLVVNVAPDPELAPVKFFDAVAKSATAKAAVCDKSFWLDGTLNAMQGDVYLSALAGLNSQKADAKAVVEQMMTIACTNV